MSTARRILIVDDDEELRETLKDQLILHDEFEVLTAGTASKGMELAKSDHYDLVVFDVSLPDMDGREAVRSPAQVGLQDADRHADRQRLRCRPDPRPRCWRQRLHHQAVQVRGAARPHPRAVAPARAERGRRLRHRPYTFKPASKLLINDKGTKIRLTEKETSILKYLYRSGDKVVSRDTLLHEVWGYNAGVTTHTLETHIYRLRQKIEKDPSSAELLVTETGGYRLVP